MKKFIVYSFFFFLLLWVFLNKTIYSNENTTTKEQKYHWSADKYFIKEFTIFWKEINMDKTDIVNFDSWIKYDKEKECNLLWNENKVTYTLEKYNSELSSEDSFWLDWVNIKRCIKDKCTTNYFAKEETAEMYLVWPFNIKEKDIKNYSFNLCE